MRPKLMSRMTLRLPEELAVDILAAARRRNCSANEVVLGAMENELARLGTYRLHYYDVIRPLLAKQMTDIDGHLSDITVGAR